MAERATSGNQGRTADTYDLDNINPDTLPQEMQGIYKSLLADYRRKTEDVANARKDSEKRVAELQAQVQQYQQAAAQINPWIQQVQQRFQEYERQRLASQPQPQDDDLDDYAKLRREIAQRDQRLQEQDQKYARLEQMINERTNQFLQLQGMQEQLAKIRMNYPGIDEDQIIEIAKGLNPGNLDIATKLAYYDQAKDAYAREYADKALADAREKWEEERQVRDFQPGAVWSGAPYMPDAPMRRPSTVGEDTPIPKSWEATKAAAFDMLQKLRSQQGGS